MAYAIDDIYIDRQGNKYKCTTAGTPPTGTPFNPNNVVNNEIMWGTVGFEKQEISGGGGGSSQLSNYKQVTRLGVSANTDINITIPTTTSFNKPPVEVLKYNNTGLSDLTQTLNTFDASEATQFTYDNTKVNIDGEMHLKNKYELNMSTPSSLGTGYISESNLIDISDYNKIEEVVTL